MFHRKIAIFYRFKLLPSSEDRYLHENFRNDSSDLLVFSTGKRRQFLIKSMILVYIIYIYSFTNTSTQVECDTSSIFKQNLKVWIQSFPSPWLVALPSLKKLVYPTICP